MSAVDRLAELLIAARSAGSPIDSVPDELMPSTMAEAEAVDDAVAALTGWPVLGWKIGCTSIYAQELLGTDGPFAGRVYEVVDSGAVLEDAALPVEPLLEGELAFTIGTSIPAEQEPLDRSALIHAVANVRPAIEVVGGRYATFVGLDVRLIIADAGANSIVALGPAADGVDLTQLGSVEATMTVDGDVTGSGSGADVLGDPLTALHWLIGHLSNRSIGLEAGQVVSTGTATQVAPLHVGSSATATFNGVGSVSLSRR